MNQSIISIIALLLVCVPLTSSAKMHNKKYLDHRIKTVKYNENKIYKMVVHHGYQSNIEFAHNETVKTISLGDSYAWRITPVGERLFIKPLQIGVRTNMTIITNYRTYQFDLRSQKPEGKDFEKELIYVLRFKYQNNFG